MKGETTHDQLREPQESGGGHERPERINVCPVCKRVDERPLQMYCGQGHDLALLQQYVVSPEPREGLEQYHEGACRACGLPIFNYDRMNCGGDCWACQREHERAEPQEGKLPE